MNALIKQNKLNGKENLKMKNEEEEEGDLTKTLVQIKVYIMTLNPPVHNKNVITLIGSTVKYLIQYLPFELEV